MVLDFDAFASLLVLAPFLAALVAPLVAENTGPAAGWILGIIPAGLCLALASLLPQVAGGEPLAFGLDWVPALKLRMSFRVDGLSLVFGLLITGIGTFILVFSGAYLAKNPRRGQFFCFMLLFLGAMLGLVLADSLVALFSFWELTAVASFLLIGFEHERMAARRSAVQALIVTGLGGLSLLAGGVLLALAGQSWDLSVIMTSNSLRTAGAAYPWVLGFIVVAAFTKSAQIPFHFWLPRAMEAPTPVSAFLHSATMVQAGVYLLARLSPILSGTAAWQVILGGFGGATLLWGAMCALRQTDLKQILAQTTVAALGLMVALLGIGGEAAALAVAAFFVAHALYKAGLFLVGGILESATGTRDITSLAGLRDSMTISFIAAALAGLSMFGIPPFVGWFAKEEIYAALGLGDVLSVLALVVVVLGNAVFGAVALALAVRPFMGAPKAALGPLREGGLPLWIGPALMGLGGFAVVFAVPAFGELIVGPMASAIVGARVESHLSLSVDWFGLPLPLSVLTWTIAVLAYWQLDRIRAVLLALERRFTWTFDRGFDQLMTALVRISAGWTRAFQHGRLELYLVIVFAALALTIVLPMLAPDALLLPTIQWPTASEAAVIALAATGVVAVVFAATRLAAIIALGVQGLALALLFMLFGAPDLGFTQLLVEILSVVVLALVMTRLDLAARDPRPVEDWLRDGTLALICGAAVALLLLRTIVAGRFDARLNGFFEANSAPLAHGRNIVNVILVDFRGLDTLGEITVVMTAGIAALALLRRQHRRGSRPEEQR